MTSNFTKAALLAVVLATGLAGVARADCESDLIQLEGAFKSPNLTAPAKAALDDAKVKAVGALKKDDDNSCHSAVAEGMRKAGLTMK
jgi:hypothetical protein